MKLPFTSRAELTRRNKELETQIAATKADLKKRRLEIAALTKRRNELLVARGVRPEDIRDLEHDSAAMRQLVKMNTAAKRNLIRGAVLDRATAKQSRRDFIDSLPDSRK